MWHVLRRPGLVLAQDCQDKSWPTRFRRGYTENENALILELGDPFLERIDSLVDSIETFQQLVDHRFGFRG